jgi:hypothetical protein
MASARWAGGVTEAARGRLASPRGLCLLWIWLPIHSRIIHMNLYGKSGSQNSQNFSADVLTSDGLLEVRMLFWVVMLATVWAFLLGIGLLDT